MVSQHLNSLLKPSRVRLCSKRSESSRAPGELLWCKKTNTGEIVAEHISVVELKSSPASYLAPGYEHLGLVNSIVGQALQLDPTGSALSTINNSLLFDDINLGQAALRQECSGRGQSDIETEARIETIIWVAAQAAQEASISITSSKMLRKMPWSNREMATVMRVDSRAEQFYDEIEPAVLSC